MAFVYCGVDRIM